MQSFLGILSYYSRFIQCFSIYELVIYDLREVDFHEISCLSNISVSVPDAGLDRDHDIGYKHDLDKTTGGNQDL